MDSGIPTSPTVQAHPCDEGVRRSNAVLEALFGSPSQRSFNVRYWDGTLERGGQDARFTVVINRAGALRRMLLPPTEISLVRSYITSDIDVEGDLQEIVPLAEAIRARLRSFGAVAKLVRLVLALPRDRASEGMTAHRYSTSEIPHKTDRHSDEAAIRFHYDVGNDFYSLWLDERMLYTCAYFRTGVEDLASAQTGKLDHICRKLRLRPGERLLDVGCGWGGLVLYAAERYGAITHGITLSAAQAELANKRIQERGLGDRCRVEVRDYRDLRNDHRYDKIASVGVTEHVARREQLTYFRKAYDLLRPGGLFLNHCEVSNESAAPRSLRRRALDMLWRRREFISQYVFPDGALVPASTVLTSAEHAGFEVRDVESLREHYTETLRHWVQRLEARRRRAIELVGEGTYRVWRLYMAGAAEGFRDGSLGLIQTLLSKNHVNGESEIPWSREDIYVRRQVP